ncbi:signal peptide, CUB and EGF-like domain-containing protein 2 [Saccostrea echinata]|uniref:signal peptide, CUB and EGF-like domain-containing protein 2 n=1 Tax=Saccostrea echinata TaxID=191078 RepID=UPI002A80DFE9|nr:signal peptide, CUB and EGF-like domain-containing protein 2 [Saccostrea echinata]
MSVNCSDEEAKNAFLAQVRIKVISRLIELAKQYPSMCNKVNVRECFQSVKVDLKACKTTSRKKRSADGFDVDIKVEIPVVSPIVTDSSEPAKKVRTETVLQEDIHTQKTEYSSQVMPLHLLYSTYVGKKLTCANGTIPNDNNEMCEACKEGTYHDTTMDVCKKCPRNFYQNSTGQTSCKACPGPVNIYTLSDGSTSESQCVGNHD